MSAAATTMAFEREHEGDLLRSGASVGRSASARSGYMPLALEHVVLQGLAAMPVFLRTIVRGNTQSGYQFTLYCAPATPFTDRRRARLREAGVKFIYIALENQMQFRRQVEQYLQQAVTDPALAISAKSELVYETSVELIDELLIEQGLAGKLPRLETIAKAVTTLVMNNADAFSHLFAASQHDFYTAAHMVNVGTWMVPLAYALGIHDMDELNLMCIAGMVHDIGKIFIPEEILNKKGRLSESDRSLLRQHPDLGVNHLKTFEGIPDLVLTVTHQHHERMNGSGYPRKLTGEQIHLASRICAVVDSFDAMTAFRPFKTRTESFGAALNILQSEVGTSYDARIVEAWVGLMQRAEKDGVLTQPLQLESVQPGLRRRCHERFSIDCPGEANLIETAGAPPATSTNLQITAHSISRSGLGFLSRHPMKTAQYLCVRLFGNGTLADRQFEGQIVRCRKYTDGWYEIGMQFASLTAEHLAAQDAPAAPA